MATVNPVQGLRLPAGTAKKFTGWFIGFAILFILLGIFSLAEPLVAALAVVLLVGWVLIFAGVAHLVSAFGGGETGRVFWHVLIGILYLVGGFYFVTHPVMAVGTLTLLLAGIILAEAVIEIIAYFRARSSGGSMWLLVNALITLLLGGLIWIHWPSSSTWAIGTLLGVNLLMTGISRLMFGMAARKLLSAQAAK
jgi:uncharacterized membrane protein HdeD (DUF308 family)